MLASGYILGTRGIGTLIALVIVGRLIVKYDARLIILFGLTLSTGALWVMVGWNTDVSAQTIALTSIAQGFGLGFLFVPINTIAFATLPTEMRTEGAALWTLIRNIGSSVGISIMIAQLTNMITIFHSQLVEHVTPFNDAMRLPDAMALAGRSLRDLGFLDGLVTQQAAVIAYSNDFLLMTLISLIAFPLLALFRSTRAAPAEPSEHAA